MLKGIIDQLNKCTGCTACYSICPQKAITVIEDPAQYYGYVCKYDDSLCISCGLCEKVCPVSSPQVNTNTENPECYAIYADTQTLMKSSSGGAFSLLANYVLDQGGVISGASYDENLNISHILVDSKEQLDLLRRSKYVQSFLGDIFLQIKEHLQNKIVLFVGTPCQVAGLKQFIGDNDNLYCIDLYCGHTPSNHIFHTYLGDAFIDGLPISYDFRTKQMGWVSDTVTVTTFSGQTTVLNTATDAYQKCYHSKLSMRRVCENCQFSSRPRQGDLSIADFWWIEDKYPKLKNPLGTSALLVNNARGQYLLKQVAPHAVCCEKVDLEAMNKNRPSKVDAHKNRDYFYSLLSRKSFSDAVSIALQNHFDVIVWGNWSEKNYGSELTYFALYTVLKNMEKEVLMVERPKTAVWGPNDSPVLFRNNPYPDYVCYIPDNKTDMVKLNHYSDTFIVGSDQIWHHDLFECFGSVCYLDYIYGFHKKISFASSFGKDDWEGSAFDISRVSLMLSDFDYISTREPSGKKICKEKFHVDADWVLDPVFLCPVSAYVSLAEKAQKEYKCGSHIAVYILDSTPRKESLINLVEEKRALSSCIISDAFIPKIGSSWNHDIFTNASVEDWLANIYYSDYVITDSFHGMCLSIIFKKQFLAISNPGRGATRFNELLSFLGLENRLLQSDFSMEEVTQLLSTDIDYSMAENALTDKINYSMEWLRSALNAPKPHHLNHSVLLEAKLMELQETISDSFSRINDQIDYIEKIQKWHTERLDYQDTIQKWQTDRLNNHDKIQAWHTERIDDHEKIQNWHTERLDNHDKIQQWHTERIDNHEKIQKWHTERINQLESSFYKRFKKKLQVVIESKVQRNPSQKKTGKQLK